MVKITLKPLDDGQKAVDIPVGKTTIGRGPFLGCGDKKVSRNHAILEVTEQGEVYLTPTHVNPCFYQPTADNPGTILKKDKPHKLENGDAFSLLPRAFRYQVIVTNDITEKKIEERNEVKKDEKTNGSTEEKPKPKESKIEIKEAVKEEIIKPKEIQEEKPKEIAILELSYNNENVKEETAKIKTEQEVNGTIAVNVKETVSKETREAKASSQDRTRRTLPVWLEELTESAKQEKKKPQPSKQQKEKQRIKKKAETQVKRKIRKNERSESDEEVEEQERERPRRSTGRSSRQNRQTRQGLSLEDFIVSDDEEWQSDKSEPKLKRRRGQRKGDDSGSDWEAEHGKKRKSRRFDSESESGSDWGTSSRKKKLPKTKRRRSKRVAVSEEGSDEEVDGDKPSKGMKGDKRIPCTYGKKCYRKNPNHMDQFSHPGDSDYNSESEPNQRNDEGGGGDAKDGKEEKPECQFGLSCFRKNPQHRNDYKHTKKVRPQREAAKQAGKKTTGLENDDEPDSYDLNDSFLNEESDEYKPMESGSDWESGEDVERLIKEAKGFVKNKKMQKHV